MSKFTRILMFVPGVFLTTWGLSRLADGNDAMKQLVAGAIWLCVAFFVGRITSRVLKSFGELDRELAERNNRQQELLATGMPASARILQVRQTGVVIGRTELEVRLTLQVEHARLGSYQAETETIVPMVALPRIQPEQTVEVRVDANDPRQVAIVV